MATRSRKKTLKPLKLPSIARMHRELEEFRAERVKAEKAYRADRLRREKESRARQKAMLKVARSLNSKAREASSEHEQMVQTMEELQKGLRRMVKKYE
jgi:hypothetical protein